MKRTLAVFVVMLASVACSKGGTTVTPASPSATIPGGIVTSPPGATGATGSTGTDIGITGTWTGSWQTDAGSTSGLGKGTFTMEFVQQGEDISGDITIQGSACLTQGSITGKMQGDKIEFGVVQAEQTVAYSGAISGDSLSGTYATPDVVGCGPDTGTWEATRV